MILVLMGVAAVLGLALGRALEFLAVRAWRIGRVRVLFLDPDSVRASFRWARVRGNEVDVRERGSEPRTFVLEGKARWNLSGSALWLVHPRWGWNYHALPDEKTVNRDGRLKALALSNPAAYYHAIRRNEGRDALEANNDAEHWIVKVAPLALLGLLLVMIGVAVIVYRLWSGEPPALAPSGVVK